MARFHETELRCDLPNGASTAARIRKSGKLAWNIPGYGLFGRNGGYAGELVPGSLYDQPYRIVRESFIYWHTPRGHNAFFELYEAATASGIGSLQRIQRVKLGYYQIPNWKSARIGMSEDQRGN